MSAPTTEGVARVLVGYLREQVERGWDVTLACPGTGWLGEEAAALGVRVETWYAARAPGPGLAREVATLSRVVARDRPHAVHLHSAKAGLAGRLTVRGRRPTLFQPHAWSFLAATGALRTASLLWERQAVRWTSELVCVSESERRLGLAHGVSAPTTVVPNGVDLAGHRAGGTRARAAARAALRLPDAPTVVCVGRLAPQKGQADLLAAWSAVRARVPDARLVLVGDGPDRRRLEDSVQPGDGVDLVGARADVPLWLAAADVVAVPSRWEGMALVPLEAMASARSVVATDVTGVADSVPCAAGAVVATGSPLALADAVVTRLLDPERADAEGRAGRAHVEARHDAAASARTVAEVTMRLAAAPPVR
ncbi:glycosyltransferase [Nocardioides sp. cx-173]|uniref:glycosyltransferase n=1 Tax=Nocardioides sp. cx-173 TaxID=2898796 RepID=UPI001E46F215|nr:glycosyltransferase [Nocardioides sp. cx-173]MCD4526287.1 glycosyltransferase [Nocardioides sp. cx-173]UGB40505.1 glycosyltransferase [Nocardioides sp. cx-173]